MKREIPAKSRLKSWLRNLPEKLLLAWSAKREIDGIRIASWGLDKANPGFQKLESALEVLRAFDPVRFSRIKRDVPLIWIFTTAPNQAEWNPDTKVCVLDRDYLLSSETAPIDVAATIVHEATHARLFRAGINYDSAIRTRIESICFKEEIRFAKKLPDGQKVIALAQDYLNLPPSVWTDEALEGAKMEELRRLKALPKWFVNWIERRVRKRHLRK